MALHATDDIGDAYEATKSFLLPFELWRWLKLALVAVFVGGGVSFPSVQFNSSSVSPGDGPGGPGVPSDLPAALPVDLVTLLIGVVAAAVFVGITFGVVGAIMEFVFVESLRRETVSLRHYWSDRWRQGLRLFGFRIVVGVPVLAVLVGWALVAFGPMVGGVRVPRLSIAVLLLGIPVLFLVVLVVSVVNSLTTVFVVPLMIQADSGVLAAWRRLWPSIRREWKQYLAYLVVAFLLSIGVGILATILVGLAALVLLIPFAVVGIAVYAALSLSSTVGLVALAGVVVLYGLAMATVWALVQVPVVTYLRYYALLVLGDVEPEFDIIADRRRAIREAGATE